MKWHLLETHQSIEHKNKIFILTYHNTRHYQYFLDKN